MIASLDPRHPRRAGEAGADRAGARTDRARSTTPSSSTATRDLLRSKLPGPSTRALRPFCATPAMSTTGVPARRRPREPNAAGSSCRAARAPRPAALPGGDRGGALMLETGPGASSSARASRMPTFDAAASERRPRMSPSSARGPTFATLLARGELSVSQAGYNTASISCAPGVGAVLVPFEAGTKPSSVCAPSASPRWARAGAAGGATDAATRLALAVMPRSAALPRHPLARLPSLDGAEQSVAFVEKLPRRRARRASSPHRLVAAR